jgi:hypothetical protein
MGNGLVLAASYRETMRRTSMGLALGCLLLAAMAALREEAPATAPAVGERVLVDRTNGPIRYRHIVRTNPNLHLHIVQIDLTDPRVRIRVCPGGDDPDGDGYWNTSLQTVRAIAQRENLAIAVNGNFFHCKDSRSIAGRKIPYFVGNWAHVTGFAMSDGRLLSWKDAGEGSMLVDKHGKVRIGYLHAGGFDDPKHDAAPTDAWQMVSGFGLLVSDGKPVAHMLDHDAVPRTVVGIDGEGKKLVLLVADGRRPDYSVGLTGEQVAQEMIKLGCRSVLNLDGGGSSTMVMRDPSDPSEAKLMNRPSDGHDLPISMSFERAVGCALGVQIVEKPK